MNVLGEIATSSLVEPHVGLTLSPRNEYMKPFFAVPSDEVGDKVSVMFSLPFERTEYGGQYGFAIPRSVRCSRTNVRSMRRSWVELQSPCRHDVTFFDPSYEQAGDICLTHEATI